MTSELATKLWDAFERRRISIPSHVSHYRECGADCLPPRCHWSWPRPPPKPTATVRNPLWPWPREDVNPGAAGGCTLRFGRCSTTVGSGGDGGNTVAGDY